MPKTCLTASEREKTINRLSDKIVSLVENDPDFDDVTDHFGTDDAHQEIIHALTLKWEL